MNMFYPVLEESHHGLEEVDLPLFPNHLSDFLMRYNNSQVVVKDCLHSHYLLGVLKMNPSEDFEYSLVLNSGTKDEKVRRLGFTGLERLFVPRVID